MDNSTVMKILKEEGGSEKKAAPEKKLSKYVIFAVGDTPFALPADLVREISFQNDLYYVPFLPPYVRGYANRHGQPHTVLDLRMLFEKKPLDSSALLILNIENDQLALLISDVDEIAKVPDDAIHGLAAKEEDAAYFAASIGVKGREIFALSVETLIKRLERDVERI